MIDLHDVFKRCDGIRYRFVGDEAVVIDQRTARVVVLNEVGAVAFDRLDGEAPVSAVIDGLEDEYEVERPVLEQDILSFLGDLVNVGLVEQSCRSANEIPAIVA